MSLSDKIFIVTEFYGIDVPIRPEHRHSRIDAEDVKQAVRELKNGMPNQDLTEAKEQEKFIDEIFGEKLI